MGRPHIDCSGQRYGRLLVMRMAPRIRRPVEWICVCDCGKTVTVRGSHLHLGSVQSCGCLQLDSQRTSRRTHGMSGGAFYARWKSMVNRCTLPSDTNYHKYGARGIRVCARWLKFENFRDDMLPSFAPHLTIERIDNNGNYDPDNCRWATPTEQMLNTRRSKYLTLNGVSRRLRDWAGITGISYGTLQSRLKRGWSHEKALTETLRTGNKR